MVQENDTLTAVETCVGDKPLKILIVDDELVSRKKLFAVLDKAGHTCFEAENGQEGVDAYERERPDIVIMDVLMPVMDGYEATRIIKKQSGERFVPVICLTGLEDDVSLAKCVAAGADDFLSKPVNRIILNAKIDALRRISQLYNTVTEQKEQLGAQFAHLEQEQETAQKVFVTMVNRGCLDAPNLKYLISPLALFNGDVLFAAPKPSGGLHVMLGDFTGHGLPAAFGAIPVSDIFYAMTIKGYSIGEIVLELNTRLHTMLPANQFLAACLLDLDSNVGSLTIWNGAIPDVVVINTEGDIKYRLKSRNIPLGVVGRDIFESIAEVKDIGQGERIYIYSDGLIEARSPDGEMFGQERLDKYFSRRQPPVSLFEDIRDGFTTFCVGETQEDDITIVEIICDKDAVLPRKPETDFAPDKSNRMDWKVIMDLTPETLRTVDPLPLIIHYLTEDERLYQHRENIYLILSELFANALEHGLLRLDSKLKKDAEGFARFFAEREKKLAELESGMMQITLEHTFRDEGGVFAVSVEDSGPGFDHHKRGTQLADNVELSGRGIQLVKSLCKKVVYHGRGNRVEAVYEWS